LNILSDYFKKFLRNLRKLAFSRRVPRKFLTVAIIHYDGKGLKDVIGNFSVELKSADVIVGKNFSKEDLKILRAFERSFQNKHILLTELDNSNSVLYHHGNYINHVNSFDIKKLRSFENHGTVIVVVNDKKLGWMISQMFPFYCIIPGEPFQETLITAPIPLTRNSDGYYFSKISYRNQVTIIDLNIEILSDFKAK